MLGPLSRRPAPPGGSARATRRVSRRRARPAGAPRARPPLQPGGRASGNPPHRPAGCAPAARQKGRKTYTRAASGRSEEHTSELQSPCNLVCRLLLEKKKKKKIEIS